jgi:hypothetical protein
MTKEELGKRFGKRVISRLLSALLFPDKDFNREA